MNENTCDNPNVDITLSVDAKGLRCPMPLLKAKQALNQVACNEVIEVCATDSGSVRDFHSFIELTEHEMISTCEDNGIYTYKIRKGAKR